MFCNFLLLYTTYMSAHMSVETLFGWGGNCLHGFARNLFRKRCTKFHQIRPSSVRDITKNILVLFFPDTLYF